MNAAFAYNAAGSNDKAEASFRRALALDPNSMAVHLNLGMLLGEQSRLDEAEDAFRRALKVDPNSAVAAFNLGVILAPKHPPEAIKWCGAAYRLRPDQPKYGYTYAYYLYQNGDADKAANVLQSMINRRFANSDTYAMLGAIHQKRGELNKARETYRAATKNNQLSQRDRNAFETMIQRLR